MSRQKDTQWAGAPGGRQSRRRLLGGALAAVLVGGVAPRRPAAHPYHGTRMIDVEVLSTRVEGRMLDLALRVAASGEAVELADAYVLGAIVRRSGLPVKLEGSGPRDLALQIRFPGPVPARFRLDLLIVPPSLLQSVEVVVSP